MRASTFSKYFVTFQAFFQGNAQKEKLDICIYRINVRNMHNTTIDEAPYYIFDNITVARGDTCILRHISLTLYAGTCIVLYGKNGSGKSSLLRYIAGLDGNGVPTEEVKPSIGYIGHTLALKMDMSVRKNLRHFKNINGSTVDIDSTIDKFQCTDIQYRKIQYCSAGQKQRVALTRLLLESHKVWLLDEPTTALDKDSRKVLFDTIQILRDTGTAFVIATHDNLDLPNIQYLNLSKHNKPVEKRFFTV